MDNLLDFQKAVDNRANKSWKAVLAEAALVRARKELERYSQFEEVSQTINFITLQHDRFVKNQEDLLPLDEDK